MLFGVETGSLALLVLAAVVAGLVRGFAGFGTALIFVPLAGAALPPLWALVVMTVMDSTGPLPNVPRAWREGRRSDLGVLALAALLGLMPGLWLLDWMSDEVFRWLVSGLCLATVALMLSGWRWSGRMTRPHLLSLGAVSGVLGGVSGLSGPPVVLTYMAAPYPAAVIRATILLYLVVWDLMFGAVLLVQGKLSLAPLALGACLIAPYMAANILGAWLFTPARERLYRMVAYGIITAAALVALPI